ncbi:MAG TPA: hypothetical protein VF088_08265, partial [Pyrinomonadaceae bacterium]
MIQIQKGDVLVGDEACAALTHGWDELARANSSATIFQTSSWYKAWLAIVANHECAQPLILRYPATGPIRAGVALQINSETIRPLSAPWADYHDGVGNPFDFEAVESLA